MPARCSSMHADITTIAHLGLFSLLTSIRLFDSLVCLTGFRKALYPRPDSSRSYPYEFHCRPDYRQSSSEVIHR